MGKKEKKDKDEKKEKKEKKEKGEQPPATLDLRKMFKESQRFPTPPLAEPTRAFYESLYGENPDSAIAIRFCVEYGIFSLDKHKTLLKKYNFLRDKGAFSVQAQIKKALEKKADKMLKKDKKDKKE